MGAGGLKLAADEGGDPAAPTVVLLHGGGQTRKSWGGAMRDLLKRGYHVINLDLRGHGDSAWSPEGDYSLRAYVEDLACVLDDLNAEPALVGASMGGATSLMYVGTRVDAHARALVLVDIVPRINLNGALKIMEFMNSGAQGFASLDEAAAAVSAYNPHRPHPKDHSGLMKNLRRRDDGRLYWHWDPKMLAEQERAEPPQFTKQLTEAAQGVRIPTLLVRGMQSDIVSEEGVTDLRRHVPQLEVWDVAGAGHMVAGDRNDAFNQGVFAFLERHLPPV